MHEIWSDLDFESSHKVNKLFWFWFLTLNLVYSNSYPYWLRVAKYAIILEIVLDINLRRKAKTTANCVISELVIPRKPYGTYHPRIKEKKKKKIIVGYEEEIFIVGHFWSYQIFISLLVCILFLYDFNQILCSEIYTIL